MSKNWEESDHLFTFWFYACISDEYGTVSSSGHVFDTMTLEISQLLLKVHYSLPVLSGLYEIRMSYVSFL